MHPSTEKNRDSIYIALNYQNNIELSIIIPAKNEENSLEILYKSIINVLDCVEKSY